MDLFLIAAESSADLLGANLVKELLAIRPELKIGAVAGPLMRELPIEVLFPMENLQVMGFIDVLAALPKIGRQFFAIRKKILLCNPKAVVCIDYPGFNLRLETSLRKNGYKGKLIHYVSPSVWAWGKRWIPKMAKNLDLLLTLFPFEAKSFASTSLKVECTGHPLASQIPAAEPMYCAHSSSVNLSGRSTVSNILALFPGSRKTEIERNFLLQLSAAKKLLQEDPSLQIAVSVAHPQFTQLLQNLCEGTAVIFYPFDQKMDLMRRARAAIATSGTVTLELALHKVPTVVCYAIRPLDLWIAQKIFRINLPFYCIVNIIVASQVFPELFGPNLTPDALFFWTRKLWTDPILCAQIRKGCTQVRGALGSQNAAVAAATAVCNSL